MADLRAKLRAAIKKGKRLEEQLQSAQASGVAAAPIAAAVSAPTAAAVASSSSPPSLQASPRPEAWSAAAAEAEAKHGAAMQAAEAKHAAEVSELRARMQQLEGEVAKAGKKVAIAQHLTDHVGELGAKIDLLQVRGREGDGRGREMGEGGHVHTPVHPRMARAL